MIESLEKAMQQSRGRKPWDQELRMYKSPERAMQVVRKFFHGHYQKYAKACFAPSGLIDNPIPYPGSRARARAALPPWALLRRRFAAAGLEHIEKGESL
jgi:hypothetical protein